MRRRRSRILGLSILLAVVLLPTGAFARTVYLNGVKLDASTRIKPQTFEGCNVRFDEKGDIYISAKGYSVEVETHPIEPPTQAPATPAAPRRGYWLISKQTSQGAVQYDIDVFINDQFVKKIRSAEGPTVLEVSKYIQGGENHVRMVATKNLGGGRVSTSPAEVLEVILGEGSLSGSTVTVDRITVDFKRTANEVQRFQQDFSFKSAP
jgi:hypothetical protein